MRGYFSDRILALLDSQTLSMPLTMELQRWIVRAMEREGLGVNAIEPRDAAARAETRPVQQSGGRFVTVACSYSETYHSAADRWPETIDVATLARYANALATGVLELAEQTT
jgi:hypothetical protein